MPIIMIFVILAINLFAQSDKNTYMMSSAKDTLVVLWTSGDPELAEKVCFLYTNAALEYSWYNKVIFIVWGPSAKLLSENKGLQTKLKSMKSNGAQLQACIVCADSYGVSEKLRDMGIEVIGTGKPLTRYLKRGYSILTF